MRINKERLALDIRLLKKFHTVDDLDFYLSDHTVFNPKDPQFLELTERESELLKKMALSETPGRNLLTRLRKHGIVYSNKMRKTHRHNLLHGWQKTLAEKGVVL